MQLVSQCYIIFIIVYLSLSLQISALVRSDKVGLGYTGSAQSMDSFTTTGGMHSQHNKMLRRYQDVVQNESKRKKL